MAARYDIRTVNGVNAAGVSLVEKPVVGAHANAWNAAVVGVGGTSNSVDAQYADVMSAFGNASAATTITLQVSQNNTNWYDGSTQVLAGPGDFCINALVGARYVRLKSSAAATITATVAGCA